jgi:hypothetical protein
VGYAYYIPDGGMCQGKSLKITGYSVPCGDDPWPKKSDFMKNAQETVKKAEIILQ